MYAFYPQIKLTVLNKSPLFEAAKYGHNENRVKMFEHEERDFVAQPVKANNYARNFDPTMSYHTSQPQIEEWCVMDIK